MSAPRRLQPSSIESRVSSSGSAPAIARHCGVSRFVRARPDPDRRGLERRAGQLEQIADGVGAAGSIPPALSRLESRPAPELATRPPGVGELRPSRSSRLGAGWLEAAAPSRKPDRRIRRVDLFELEPSLPSRIRSRGRSSTSARRVPSLIRPFFEPRSVTRIPPSRGRSVAWRRETPGNGATRSQSVDAPRTVSETGRLKRLTLRSW